MEIKGAYLILADISGYTRFVKIHRASILHAEEIVTELMEAVIDAAGPPLILNKLEGDAAFLYAPADCPDTIRILRSSCSRSGDSFRLLRPGSRL